MPQCAQCLLDLSVHADTSPNACPNCGKRLTDSAAPVTSPHVAPTGPGTSAALISRFFASVRDVIFRPATFFATRGQILAAEGGLSSALTFAVIVQWLSAFFNFIWTSSMSVLIQDRMEDFFRIAGDVMDTSPGMNSNLGELRQHAIDFLFGAGAVVLTPFTTLLKLVMVGALIHVAVRFFVNEQADRPHRFSTTLKILAYSSAPWILCIIPGFGVLLAWILSFAASVYGLREVYRTTTFRAVIAVTFPEILFMTLFFLGLVLLLFVAFNVMRLVF